MTRLPVDVRVLAVDTTYRTLDYPYLEQLASAFRTNLEQEVAASRQAMSIDTKLTPSYQAVNMLSKDLGLVRVGFHDGLHQVTVIGWKDKRMHLVQCRDNDPIDVESGACGTDVRKVFGPVFENAHIPFTWTGGVKGRFVPADMRDGVSLKAESAPAEQAAELTRTVLESIAQHMRSQTDWVAREAPGVTQQSVDVVTRDGERVGIVKLVRAGSHDLRTVVVLRDGELQRITCMHRLDDAYQSPESGPCKARVREVFGFSL